MNITDTEINTMIIKSKFKKELKKKKVIENIFNGSNESGSSQKVLLYFKVL